MQDKKTILYLMHCMDKNVSLNRTSKRTHLGRSTIYRFWQRRNELNMTLEDAKKMDEDTLSRLFYHQRRTGDHKAPLDYLDIYQQIRVKTKRQIWMEYVSKAKDKAYQYSQFCRLYRSWEQTYQIKLEHARRQYETTFFQPYGHTLDYEVLLPSSHLHIPHIYYGTCSSNQLTIEDFEKKGFLYIHISKVTHYKYLKRKKKRRRYRKRKKKVIKEVRLTRKELFQIEVKELIKKVLGK